MTATEPAKQATHASAAGESVIKDFYDPALTNEDLAPLKEKKWSVYNYFAFWMTDVHSVAGYTTAGSLFALGLAGWEVFVAIIIGVVLIYVLCNLIAKPSQIAGVPYPVASRVSFGVIGANVPAVIRGLIAVAWYGIQTYLASQALNILILKIWPGAEQFTESSFVGLSALGWFSFLVMWVAQAFVFWHGMDAIKKFIDFAGPAVYVVMLVLAIYLVAQAGWENVQFTLPSPDQPVGFWATFGAIAGAVALVVSYFSGPMLNFGDFARYGKTFDTVKKGNLLGLPVNFVFFAILVVVTVSAAATVFGRAEDGSIIVDPVEMVGRIDNTAAVILGVLTILVATVGINIVANFVSPAFDFSHVNPQRISWRTGGMIAAVASVVITPWNLFNSATAIHYTLDTLAAVTGPLYGILIADYYLTKKQKIIVDDLYIRNESSAYWYYKGWNPNAVIATVVGGGVGIAIVLFASMSVAQYNWFITAILGFVTYFVVSRVRANPAANAESESTTSV